MALQRRLPPSHPLRLELATDGGMTDIREFKLCFDVNAAAVIKEKTGVSLLNFVEAWTQIGDPRLLRVMFWAAVLAHHPEYNSKDDTGKLTDEGLETIGSLVDETVSEKVAEALWETYLKSLSPAKRKAVLELRKLAEEQAGKPNPPAPSGSTGPATATAIPTTTNGSSSTPSPATSELELTNSAK